MKTRIYLFIYLCLSFLFISCEKKTPLNENFIGNYRVIKRFPNRETNQMSFISAGNADELITWKIDGRTFNLKINEINPNRAQQTNFSVPIFADMSCSLTRIHKDTLEGFYSHGSIFLSGYKSENFYLVK